MGWIPAKHWTAMLAASLLGVASILFVRRGLGGFESNLPLAEVLIYTAIFSAVSAIVCRAAIVAERFCFLAYWGIWLTTLLFVGSLTSYGPHLIVGLLSAIGIHTLEWYVRNESMPLSKDKVALTSGRTWGDSSDEDAELDDPEAAATQTLTRRDCDGVTVIEGVIAFELPANTQVTVIQIPFWPALADPPTVECELEGFTGRVRPTFAAVHGLRLEVRAAETSTEIRQGIAYFSATSEARKAA